MNNEFWEFTPMGHRPRWEIKCPVCQTPLRLRYSQIFRPNDVFQALENPSRKMGLTPEEKMDILTKCGWAEDRAYKCPKCQHWEIYGIPLSWEELQQVREARRPAVWVPIEEWSEDHPIMQKLSSMGYW